MPQQSHRQFGYQSVQLIKTEPIGTGSYGAVYKAKCDDLLCAGKILHPTLFQSDDPGSMTIMRQFQQECSFLSELRHPNIVQYLHSYQDPETHLPVLLMELMDDSLTRFLEQSHQQLPYHIQVNICHDIALALAYLHSNDIIHRDLSSNNVFVIGAGNRAKVTDFGMAKLFDVKRTTMTRCPGTQAYMSPEALDDTSVYTKKLDTFSFGVLDIQIITRQFPEPGRRVKKVQDPRDPRCKLQEVVPETERRKAHIDLIDPTHPLLPIAIDCLSYNEEDRSSAQELCHRLAALKRASQYDDSMKQAQQRSRPAQSTTADGEGKIRELQQEKEDLQSSQQIHDLQHQLQVCDGQIQEKDAIIAASEKEIQHLRQENQGKDHVIEAREKELQELNQLAANKQEEVEKIHNENQRLQKELQKMKEEHHNFEQREKLIQELREENQHLRQVLQEKFTLNWNTCEAAPHVMNRGSATVCGNMAYFRPDGSNKVHSYNSDTVKWSTLPDCQTYDFTLTVVNSFVTAVGGSQFAYHVIQKNTNTLLSLMEEDGTSKWEERFPPMPTKRKLTAVVCSGKVLVVAGGLEGGANNHALTTVEVMDTEALQWSTASSLPHPLFDATATVCGDHISLVGGKRVDHGYNFGYNTKSVLTCSLSALLQSQKVGAKMKSLSLAGNHSVWRTIDELPVSCSTSVILNGKLLAVGGLKSDKITSAVYAYNTEANSWEVISHMPTCRRLCLVAVLPGDQLMVVGGLFWHSGNIETATFQ